MRHHHPDHGFRIRRPLRRADEGGHSFHPPRCGDRRCDPRHPCPRYRPGGIRHRRSYDAFPEGTIHVCVVDPTVGSKRRGIIVSAGNHLFIGPDNGLFSQVIGRSGSYCAVEITNGQYVRACAGPTFHGRDVFAPAAAWLSKGVELLEFGPTVDDLCLTDLQIPEEDGTGISGQVVYFDRFGNAITNIRKERIDSRGASISGIRWNETSVSMAPHYAAAGDRGLHALFNSSGYLELFVNRNDAATRYGIRKGDRVTIALSPSPDIPSAET